MKKLIILGTRGVPARHGGFETFAERLSLYLTGKGWEVTVYCQEEGEGAVFEDDWHGVHRVHIPVRQGGSLGSVVFDIKAARHCMGRPGLILTLGYNTAVFNILQRISGQLNVINMDGIEWHRKKWGTLAKMWFWLNEQVGCRIGNHLIADHPAIDAHLARNVSERKITMIPYGADEIEHADPALLSTLGLTPGGYSIVIARPEPENSFLEMVSAFSACPRGHKLVVLGKFEADANAYHRSVVESAGPEVIFPGAIYDQGVVRALRRFSRLYLHGHTVGGTNPSLVEAMGAGCAVLAHDNQYNRWVAGPDAAYFSDQATCAERLGALLADPVRCEEMRAGSTQRFRERFTWRQVLQEYESLLHEWAGKLPSAAFPVATAASRRSR